MRTPTLVFSAVLLAACTQDFDQFRPGDGGAGTGGVPATGGGGNGGMTTTDGGGGSTTVTGGGGEGGCMGPVDCGNPGECATVDCIQNECIVTDDDPGTDCSTGVCDGDGACVDCLVNEDCEVDEICTDQNECAPGSCDDDVENGDETDEDCGGPACGKCAVDLKCLVPADCLSNFCDDGQNPPRCELCTDDPDCVTADEFCDDAGACVAKLPQGDPCDDAAECDSGFCEDGFCCNNACTGDCERCDSANTSAPDGTCSFVDSNSSDPNDACENLATNCELANCSGVDANCGFENANTNCGALTCLDGPPSRTSQPRCNATGQCNNPLVTSCNGHDCNGSDTACSDDCNNSSSNCNEPEFSCQDAGGSNDDPCKLAQGQPCTTGTECTSTHCVNGFCCDDACAGTCRRCDAASTNAANGTCANTDADIDPDMECAPFNDMAECNGSGACQTP